MDAQPVTSDVSALKELFLSENDKVICTKSDYFNIQVGDVFSVKEIRGAMFLIMPNTDAPHFLPMSKRATFMRVVE